MDYRDKLETNLLEYRYKTKIDIRQKTWQKLWEKRELPQLHHKICEAMFKQAEKGAELWIKIDEQDEGVYQEDAEDYSGNEEKKYYRVSIMTQAMLDYDRMMLNLISEEVASDVLDTNNFATHMYRPYFCHFLIDIVQTEREAIRFLTDEENVNQWFVGQYDLGKDEQEGRAFPGYIEQIASPVVYKDKKLIIKDKKLSPKILKEINEVYDLGSDPCSKDTDIAIELEEILDKPDFNKVKVYNIGKANCVYLYGRRSSGEVRLLYDIGHYYNIVFEKIRNTTYQRSVSAIRNLKPHCIILSHWDTDHFLGCAYAKSAIFQCKWIAPNLDKKTIEAARRVAKYLQVLNNLILVERTSGRRIADIKGTYSELKVCMGEIRPKKDKQITDCNKEGLILEHINYICHGGIHSLMAGDVPYESLPNVIGFSRYTPYDYLIVPHHGADMDTDLLNSGSTSTGSAIVCATGSKYPVEVHKKALEDNGYSVFITGKAGLRIDIDISKKCSPKMKA